MLSPKKGDGLIGNGSVCLFAEGELGSLGNVEVVEPGDRAGRGTKITGRKVPLAGPGGFVSGGSKDLANVGDRRIRSVAVEVHACLVGHAACDDAASGRAADGGRAVGNREADAGLARVSMLGVCRYGLP